MVSYSWQAILSWDAQGSLIILIQPSGLSLKIPLYYGSISYFIRHERVFLRVPKLTRNYRLVLTVIIFLSLISLACGISIPRLGAIQSTPTLQAVQVNS